MKVFAGVVPAAMVLSTSSALAPEKQHLVLIVEFDSSGNQTGVVEIEKVGRPTGEWKKQLTAEQFEVTRRAGTERPFANKYDGNHADGYTTASAAVRFSSIPRLSSIPVPAGPVSGNLSRRKISPFEMTTHMGCKETRCFAGVVTLISVMSSTMARPPHI